MEGVEPCTGFICHRTETSDESCSDGSEPSGYIKGGEFLDQRSLSGTVFHCIHRIARLIGLFFFLSEKLCASLLKTGLIG